MNGPERDLVLGRFAEYYRKARFCTPGIEKREFGIGNVKKIDARHLAFNGEEDFRRYLVQNTPMFVSHSVSYYKFPGATPIEKKLRTGADLVFDLDLHAEGKYGVYPMLGSVKADAVRLLEEFVLRDFGVKRGDVAIVFSGNRGYHLHVRDPRFFDLGSDERKEIVDYVRGTGLNYRDFFSEEVIGPRLKKLVGPRPEEDGYRGRLARAVIETLEKRPAAISRKFAKEGERSLFISGVREGNWSRTTFGSAEILGRIAPVAAALPVSAVDTDAAVTHDLSKLIRVPNSVHGETGLIAMAVEDIEGFFPLDEAFLPGNGTLKARFTEDVPELPMMGTTTEAYRKGDEKELPEQLAMFFLLKGSASILQHGT